MLAIMCAGFVTMAGLCFIIMTFSEPVAPRIPGEDKGKADSDGEPAGLNDAISSFRKKNIVNPIIIQGDPYERSDRDASATAIHTEEVCGIRYLDPEKTSYAIKTFPNKDMARNERYIITHYGPCGTCSTLQDLAVYLQYPDLTAMSVRCSFLFTQGLITWCLERYGFTRSCALTWYYNIRHTRRRCFSTCLRSRLTREPSNRPDGSLNPCLRCDEDESGPVFKKTAGRTRRNSGIVSSIRRDDREIRHITHDYY